MCDEVKMHLVHLHQHLNHYEVFVVFVVTFVLLDKFRYVDYGI